MPQLGIFAGSVSVGIGAVGILLAWDGHDRGPSAADDDNLDTSDVALYSFIAPVTGAQLAKIKTMNPIAIPEESCPLLLDGENGDFLSRVEIKSGGSALTAVCDFTLDIFDGSTLIYRAAPDGQSIKFDLADNSVLGAAISIQDRPTLQAWEDTLEGFAAIMNDTRPAKEIWRDLITPGLPLSFF
ncbi:MAG: hypothetical protein ABIS51_05185 [Sphingomonas sp.]